MFGRCRRVAEGGRGSFETRSSWRSAVTGRVTIATPCWRCGGGTFSEMQCNAYMKTGGVTRDVRMWFQHATDACPSCRFCRPLRGREKPPEIPSQRTRRVPSDSNESLVAHIGGHWAVWKRSPPRPAPSRRPRHDRMPWSWPAQGRCGAEAALGYRGRPIPAARSDKALLTSGIGRP